MDTGTIDAVIQTAAGLLLTASGYRWYGPFGRPQPQYANHPNRLRAEKVLRVIGPLLALVGTGRWIASAYR